MIKKFEDFINEGNTTLEDGLVVSEYRGKTGKKYTPEQLKKMGYKTLGYSAIPKGALYYNKSDKQIFKSNNTLSEDDVKSTNGDYELLTKNGETITI